VTIGEAAANLRARRISAVELATAALDRIETRQPAVNAFITVTRESALERARRADEELARGHDLGPLHGIPVAVKDVFSTVGVRTTCGSKLFENYVPATDAAVVERLRAAGAVLTGKTGMHELAYGITSNNPHFGAVRNPWNRECVPGGSSGGSGAAVAAGMVFMAMGSDTGGSIRIPAAYCGTVGLKPTFGRVSRYGVLPLDFSLDHMGPMTRSVRDAALVLNAIAGRDDRDDTSSRRAAGDYLPPPSVTLRGVRAGVPENFYFERIDPAVEARVRAMIGLARDLGAEIVPVRVPDIAALNAVSRVILLAEAAAVMEPHLARRERFGADVLALFDQGRMLAATDYVNAQRLRRMFQREFAQVWNTADCLLTPTTPTSAPRIGQTSTTIGEYTEDVRLMATKFVRGINVMGWPAISIPCGLDAQGMPAGLQIIGRPFDEARLLQTAAALEDASGGPFQAPPEPTL
jgi:aspartyl-tRNA(Asn)/glutamyl-tRNA(Gln) amidotransferase subunit A